MFLQFCKLVTSLFLFSSLLCLATLLMLQFLSSQILSFKVAYVTYYIYQSVRIRQWPRHLVLLLVLARAAILCCTCLHWISNTICSKRKSCVYCRGGSLVRPSLNKKRNLPGLTLVLDIIWIYQYCDCFFFTLTFSYPIIAHHVAIMAAQRAPIQCPPPSISILKF